MFVTLIQNQVPVALTCFLLFYVCSLRLPVVLMVLLLLLWVVPCRWANATTCLVAC
jgi:hypothetical protein